MEHDQRQADGPWLVREDMGSEGCPLKDLGCELRLGEAYLEVEQASDPA